MHYAPVLKITHSSNIWDIKCLSSSKTDCFQKAVNKFVRDCNEIKVQILQIWKHTIHYEIQNQKLHMHTHHAWREMLPHENEASTKY